MDNLAIKVAGDWELDIRAIPFDSKDSDGQWFDANTDISPEAFKTPLVVYFHGMQPNQQPQGEPVAIGAAKNVEKRPDGWWVRVALDKASKFAARIWEAAKNGMAAASSGSISHLARLDVGGKLMPYSKSQPGRIATWPFAELSLIDIGEGRRPANPYAVALPAMKSVYEQAGIPLPEIALTGWAEAQAVTSERDEPIKQETKMDEKKNEGLSLEDVEARINAAMKAAREQADKEAAALKAEQERIDAEVEKRVKEREAEAIKNRRLPMGDGAPLQTQFHDTYKFDNLSPGEIGLVIDTLRKNGEKPSTGAFKALALRVAEMKEEGSGYVKGAFKSATGLEATPEAIKAATDPMYTGGSNIGSDWVGTAYSNELWRSIRANNQVVSKVPSIVIPDGYSSIYYPLESTDPTWYKVAEATASDATLKVPAATVTASQAATANKQITVSKMGARVLYTGEMTEDSLIAFAPQMREQLAASGSDAMERVVIDGDTATSSNINDIGGTTYSGAAGTLFLLASGFRDLTLVTNTANSRSAAGGFAIEDFIETVKLMGTAGLAGADLGKINFIVDPNTYYAAMNLPEVKTRDVNAAATVENGFLTRAYGVGIIPSWNMHYMSSTRKANTAGKVDNDTVGNNLYGAILAVRWDQWKLAYKRRMTMEVTRIANADSWEIVALSRWGLAYRDTEAAAATYYVGV